MATAAPGNADILQSVVSAVLRSNSPTGPSPPLSTASSPRLAAPTARAASAAPVPNMNVDGVGVSLHRRAASSSAAASNTQVTPVPVPMPGQSNQPAPQRQQQPPHKPSESPVPIPMSRQPQQRQPPLPIPSSQPRQSPVPVPAASSQPPPPPPAPRGAPMPRPPAQRPLHHPAQTHLPSPGRASAPVPTGTPTRPPPHSSHPHPHQYPATAHPTPPPSQHIQHYAQDIPAHRINSGSRPPDPRIAERTAIMDPPRDVPAPDPESDEDWSFESPGRRGHSRGNTKFDDDVSRLTYAIQQCLPESVRYAVRENWQKCVLGSDYHQAFLLNTLLSHMTPTVFQKTMRHMGEKLVEMAKHEFVNHLTAADIDELGDVLIYKASDRFLDTALEARLRTIEAKPLINALARAERLGYEPDDIIEDPASNGQERVIPQHHAPAAPGRSPDLHGAAPPPPASRPRAIWQCAMCNRVFHLEAPFVYHVEKQVCMQRPADAQVGFRYACAICGQGFTHASDLKYHNGAKVCEVYVASSQQHHAPRALPPNTGTSYPPQQPTPHARRVATPPRQQYEYRSSQPQPSSQPPIQFKSPPVLKPHGGHGHVGDPYAHLTDAQMAALTAELQNVEASYGERMREAEAIPDPAERRAKLDGLKNSFGTRQSLIRKKYGVRLRERRTKAEIDAERTRMRLGDSSPATARTNGNSSAKTSPASAQPHASNGDGRDIKRARVDTDANGTANGANGSYQRAGQHDDHDTNDLKHKVAGGPPANDAYPASAVASAALALDASRRPVNVEDNMSDSSSDNDDIPARLPDAVRESLGSQSRQ